MEPQAIEAAALAGSVASHDFSMISLFLRADIIVQMVMMGLVGASVWCWAVIFDKVMKLRILNRQADAFEDAFWSGSSPEELYQQYGVNPDSPMAATFANAWREWELSAASQGRVPESMKAGLMDRLRQVSEIAINREMEALEKRLGYLATVGSTAPFIGLFGTVWGIMNSFQSIALSHNTSLAVVAPGIAEALFATALGLVAAIPAVIAYNKISLELGRYADRLEGFSGEFIAVLSRRLHEEGHQ